MVPLKVKCEKMGKIWIFVVIMVGSVGVIFICGILNFICYGSFDQILRRNNPPPVAEVCDYLF